MLVKHRHLTQHATSCHRERESVVHRLLEVLLAAEVTLGRQHRRMPQQKLSRLQLPAAAVTQLGAGSPEIMRDNMVQPCALATIFNHIPNDILGDTVTPYPSGPPDSTKDPAFSDSRR